MSNIDGAAAEAAINFLNDAIDRIQAEDAEAALDAIAEATAAAKAAIPPKDDGDVLVKVTADIVVRVPNHWPIDQASDGLNEGFNANPEFFVDWSYMGPGGGLRFSVLANDPDDYEEGDAWLGEPA